MRMIKAAVALGLMVSAPAAYASNAGAGYVSNVTIANNGVVLFTHSGAKYGDTTCASPNPSRWAFDGNTTAGQAKLASVLTAYSLHKQISIVGMNQCLDQGDVETIWNFTTIES